MRLDDVAGPRAVGSGGVRSRRRYLARGGSSIRHPLLGGLAALVFALAAAPLARADILIGVGAQLTGSNAWTGEQMQQGAEMAVRDINASGGVLGQKIKLIVADDACKGPQAVSAAEKLVGDGVVFVAGHACSAASIPASEVYHRAGIPQISPASTNPMLTELGRKNVFRVCGRDDQQGVVAGDYLADHFTRGKIAIVHDGSTYGKGLAEETKKQLNKRGLGEVLFEAIAPGLSDYSWLVPKLRAADASVLYFGGYAAEAALILGTAREAGLKVRLVSGDALATDQFMQIAGPEGDGTVFTSSPDARRQPVAADVAERSLVIVHGSFHPTPRSMVPPLGLFKGRERPEHVGDDQPPRVGEQGSRQQTLTSW